MEMEYKDTSRRGKVIMVVGVILALAAGASAFFLINQAQQAAGQAGLNKVAVVVAAREIPARKVIEDVDLEVREVPIDPTNERGVFNQRDALVGRVLAVAVLQGQLVTSNMLASSASGGQFTIIDPTEKVTETSEAWRAVSITATDDRAVGGLLQANQTVDVFVTAQVNVPGDLILEGELYTDKSTKITYQNMVILARAGNFYILKASLPVAEEISHLQAAGNAQFSLALRPEQDVRYADASDLGATTNEVIKRYGLPIPEVFPPSEGPIPTALPTPVPTPTPTPAASESPQPSLSPAP